jgi:hypothetical protein
VGLGVADNHAVVRPSPRDEVPGGIYVLRFRCGERTTYAPPKHGQATVEIAAPASDVYDVIADVGGADVLSTPSPSTAR